jgi:hypothetical protein
MSTSPSAACELLTLAAVTDRGQRASAAQQLQASRLIAELESAPDEGGEARLEGDWELVYATEAPYRSSPFFAAFRKLTEGMTAAVRPLGASSDALAESIFRITDGLPFKDVGVARQSISPTALVSRVELSINLYDALIPRGRSLMTSTATIMPPVNKVVPPGVDEAAAQSTRPLHTSLRVERTQVLESSIGELLPFLRIDDVRFPTSDVFERLRAGSSKIGMETTYLSPSMRISRYEPGQAFVWTRCGGGASSTMAPEPTAAVKSPEVPAVSRPLAEDEAPLEDEVEELDL